ncbi:FecCD family ABC transporter permease [Necropsobacter massiliensis]|uniref:FecCD family ABC transporter permease n=1 Tax=Necropsobacter massiliensis TaxID=1400001 RepID=UPI000595A38F|nr:iron ABC transporter permease [Necropsobacter massiliensis]
MKKWFFRIGLLPCILLVVVLWACTVGQTAISYAQLWQAFTGLWRDIAQDQAAVVLWNIRLPRILTAVFVGAALSVSGATYQGMFRNPLVSPDILGVTAGAGLGAVIAIYYGLSLLMIQIMAFVTGLLTVFLVYAVSQTARRQDPVLALVLSGIAVGSLFGAGIALLKILSDPYSQLTGMTFWLLGGLNMATLTELKVAVPLIILGLTPLILLRWRMNLLSLDDEEAVSLGIDIKRTRLTFILSATLMTSVAVSITGIIGWIGLVIPHIARLWGGPDFRRLLPAAFFIGAGFLVITDTVARALFPIEVPLGIITACIGAPFFLSLLIRGGKG